MEKMSSAPKSVDVVSVDLESPSCNDGASGGNAPAIANGAVENGDESKVIKLEKRESSVSECSVEIGDLELEPHFAKTERDCRICHLSMDATNHDSSGGVPIELGCSCKDDLAAAHKQCAEAWFKIKGNKTCEICGSIAQNVSVMIESPESTEQWNDRSDAASAGGSAPQSESRNFWHGHRFLNFLLACMVFAFVVSWLFHFNIPS